MRLIVALRNFVKAPKNGEYFKKEPRNFVGLMFFTYFIYIKPKYSELPAYNEVTFLCITLFQIASLYLIFFNPRYMYNLII
jgi:hypothetical protein